MILQRLLEHYDRLASSGKVKLAPAGYSLQKVSFCIVLEENGSLHSFEDMRRPEGKTLQPQTLIVPGQGKPSGSGLNPCFLWDNAEYLLGWSADPDKLPRSVRAFEECRRKHLALRAMIENSAYQAVCSFLEAWTPQAASEHAERLAGVATHFGAFRIASEHTYVHESVISPVEEVESDTSHPDAMCLVTGSMAPTARLHEPKIKGVADAQMGGALLVSFNASAFTSYGKDQSFNASVSTTAVFKYANALNHLLSLRERRIGLGDATVVFWADHASPLEDCLADLFSGPPGRSDPDPETPAATEDSARVDEARLLLTQLRDGTRNASIDGDDVPTKFFILGLSPNASRLSVRLWVEADAHELERLLRQHLRDLALKTNRDERPLSIRALANATGRYDPKGKTRFDTKGVSPQLTGELARSVLTGAPYPESFLSTMVRRVRSDAYIGFERVSAIQGVPRKKLAPSRQTPGGSHGT